MHSPTIVHVSQRGRRFGSALFRVEADLRILPAAARRIASEARQCGAAAAANTPDSCPHTAPAPDARAAFARDAAADADSAAAYNTLSAADTTRARQSAAAWLAAQARAVDSVNLIAADSPASAAPDAASSAALPARMGLLRLIAVTSSGTRCVFHANPPSQVRRRKAGESARRFLQSCRLSG